MANDFNVGRDTVLDIIDPVEGVKRFKIKTGADIQAIFNDLMSKGMDGITRRDKVPDGWRINFTFDRAGPEIDDYFARREELYFGGGELPKATITQTTKEKNGRVSQYRFTDCVLALANGGTFRGDAISTQAMEATASRRIKVQ